MAEKELTFWDHLDELRRVLFRVLGVWFVLAIGYFIAMPYLFDNVILAPCHNDFVFYDLLRWIGQKLDLKDEFFTQEFHVKLININLAAPFFVHMSTAFWMSVVTAAPYIFYEIWRFVSPALYPNERKGVRKALGIGTVMFFIGVSLGYFMVYPLTLRFLSTYQLSAAIENQISLNSYIDNFMMLVLCMGLAFELPLVTWLLSLLGLVHKTFLRKYRRHAVVIIVIASAIITPTGDPFTLTVVAVPLYLLYELSILMIKDKKLMMKRKKWRQRNDGL
ncbi:twin-arginine translocase subunit TatC [Bacteroides uniformis]|uniref:twin-arginine translocase subunit TatC n=4 Tax=Bacteroidaceae TaxID=815 RepID=UPI00125DD7D1|nr:twin-arginine translocase subunit TatC [Bacteroides uniformis]KAB3919841.1 twin-arginine translocase subunit TatC [Bacteroides uniformis]KAB3923142.1 twin-arginine translocase subunit TatC [Bacteroides uniformis]KAB3925641.1 twin-arginine translocase subunit TatC [Bacteroides uniformis]KAB3933463.1 twin-arginine translocase subunit TatC [Bacteroides uniformis]